VFLTPRHVLAAAIALCSRFTHLYFYIRDEMLGPIVMCVGTFLPFQTTYYINGNHFMEGELKRRGVRFAASRVRLSSVGME
jgi:hypothetical protein